MNWHEKLYEIYSILELNGLIEVAKEIQDEQLKGATGGEIFDLVMSRLILIKKERPEIYSLVKNEVESLIDYGKSIGYL